MDKNELKALADMLCGDESNESDEVIIDITALSYGVIITDRSHPHYNAYLLGL